MKEFKVANYRFLLGHPLDQFNLPIMQRASIWVWTGYYWKNWIDNFSGDLDMAIYLMQIDFCSGQIPRKFFA
jgi:hypothetical protein